MEFESGTRVISSYSETGGTMTGNTRQDAATLFDNGAKVEIRWDNGKVTWVSEKVARSYVLNVAWVAERDQH